MDPFASSNELFYRHSWKAPIGGLLLVAATGLTSTLLLGLVYGYVMFFIPFIYIKIFIMIGYPIVIGFIVSWAVDRGKIRNSAIVVLAGVGFGILADYAGWVAWMAAALGSADFLMAFFFPGEVLSFMRAVAEVGIYVISNSRPTGAILYLVWLVEAATVIGVTAWFVITNHFDSPFCEECGNWVTAERYIGLFYPISNQAKFQREIKQGNFSVIGELKPRKEGSLFTKLTMRECQTCSNFRLLSVKSLALSVNSKNQLESKNKTIISNLRVTPGLLSILQRLITQQIQAE